MGFTLTYKGFYFLIRYISWWCAVTHRQGGETLPPN